MSDRRWVGGVEEFSARGPPVVEAPSENRLNHHCMTSHWYRPFQPSDSLDLALLEGRYLPRTMPSFLPSAMDMLQENSLLSLSPSTVESPS